MAASDLSEMTIKDIKAVAEANNIELTGKSKWNKSKLKEYVEGELAKKGSATAPAKPAGKAAPRANAPGTAGPSTGNRNGKASRNQAEAGRGSQLATNQVLGNIRLPKNIPRDEDGRVYAEHVNIEQIAADFHMDRAITIIENQKMEDQTYIKQKLRDLDGQPGNYVWAVRAPKTKTWFAVYLGKAKNLRERLSHYVQGHSTFGPPDEPVKHAMILDLQRRGFAVQIRWRQTGVTNEEAVTAEAATLRDISFPICAQNNRRYRAVSLPSGKSVSDYRVLTPGGPIDNLFHAVCVTILAHRDVDMSALGLY